MPTCKNCGHTAENGANNCPMCGVAFEEVNQQPQAEAQPAYQQPPVQEQPVYQQPVYQQPQAQPTYNAAPVTKTVPASAKVKGFIGMGLGIEAIVSSFVSYIYVILAFVESSYYYYYDGSYAGFAIGFSLVELAMAIAGVILSSKAREAGFEAAPTKLGKIFGIISIPLYGFAMFLALIALAVNA